jgi:hypothetical protein
MRDKILSLVQQAGDEFYCAEPADVSEVKRIESVLELNLPEDYAWYLQEYGSGGIGGADILGVGFGKSLKAVNTTRRWQDLGLPDTGLVIYDAGEFAYFLCLEREDPDYGKVLRWDQGSKKSQLKYPDFLSCVADLFQEELKNL